MQTVDSVFRKDLGCITYLNVNYGTLNEKDISSEDLDIVIKEAEDFMRNAYKIKYVNPDYVFKIFNDKVILSTVNHYFVNADATPYQQEYYDINLFNTLEEAEAFVTATLKIKMKMKKKTKMSYWESRKRDIDRIKKLKRLKRGFSRRAMINFLRMYKKYKSTKPKYYAVLPNNCPVKKALEER